MDHPGTPPLTAGIAVAVIALCNAGCAPRPFDDVPSLAGKVVSARDSSPVPGAAIVATSKHRPEFQSKAVSDASGDFKIANLRRDRWVPLYGNWFSSDEGSVVVSAPGYRSVTIQYGFTISDLPYPIVLQPDQSATR